MSAFRNKIAIVTGAASGLGRALAAGLAERGATVVLVDVNAQGVEKAARGIQGRGGKAETVTADATDPKAVKGFVDQTVQRHGRLDYLFNNAGILIFGEARDISLEDWRKVIDLDLYGVVHGVAAAYPVMVSQGSGHIVNTASIEGLVAFPAMASYVASKFAVVGLSHSLRAEGAELGVKVSVVCPGYVRTRIIEDSRMVRIDREKILGIVRRGMGISPERAAAKILKGVERNRATIVITLWARVMWWIQRASPGLVSWMMRFMMRQLRKRGFRTT